MADACKVFVGNLPFGVDDKAVEDLFSEVGTVQECIVICDRDTGRSRGFGFVTFENEADAQKAIQQLNQDGQLGRNITVKEAESKRSGGGGGGYRGGGGYGGGGHRNDGYGSGSRRDDYGGGYRRGGGGDRDGGYRDGGYRDNRGYGGGHY